MLFGHENKNERESIKTPERDFPMIIAMWSGPRNLSTAMMRSFGARADCTAMDEPFYAAYLKATGLEHPMRDEIIQVGETDSASVVQQCIQPPKLPKTLVYQKHMTHHMLDAFDISWVGEVTNIFLIREPKKVLASYSAKTELVTSEDIGFRKQRELFDLATKMQGKAPAVVDANDIRANPKKVLKALCDKVGLEFSEEMLRWEKGQKPEDGIWASHWYDAVWNSTGFAPPEKEKPFDLPPHLKAIESEVIDDYRFMQQFCIKG